MSKTRSRPTFWLTSLGLLLLVVLAGAPRVAAEGPGQGAAVARPNVIFILADDGD